MRQLCPPSDYQQLPSIPSGRLFETTVPSGHNARERMSDPVDTSSEGPFHPLLRNGMILENIPKTIAILAIIGITDPVIGLDHTITDGIHSVHSDERSE